MLIDGGIAPQIGEPFVGHAPHEAVGTQQIDLINVHDGLSLIEIEN